MSRCRSVVAVLSPAQYTPPQLLAALSQLSALSVPPVVVLLQVRMSPCRDTGAIDRIFD